MRVCRFLSVFVRTDACVLRQVNGRAEFSIFFDWINRDVSAEIIGDQHEFLIFARRDKTRRAAETRPASDGK